MSYMLFTRYLNDMYDLHVILCCLHDIFNVICKLNMQSLDFYRKQDNFDEKSEEKKLVAAAPMESGSDTSV